MVVRVRPCGRFLGGMQRGAGCSLAPLFFSVSDWPGIKFTLLHRRTLRLCVKIKIYYYILLYIQKGKKSC